MTKHSSVLVALVLSALTSVVAFAAVDPAAVPTTTSQPIELQATQQEPVSLMRPNAMSVELLGRAGLYSVNYDRSLTSWLGIGVGASFVGIGDLNHGAGAFIFPINLQFYALPDQHRPYLTLGGNVLTGFANWGTQSAAAAGFNMLNVGIGYEYRSREGFLLRVTPYLCAVHGTGQWVLFPLIGLTLGATF